MKIIRDHYIDIIDRDKLEIDDCPEKMMFYLLQKFQEEKHELVESNCKEVEEYADLIQVVLDLARLNDISIKDIEQTRHEKEIRLGGFKMGIYLK